MAQSFVLDDGCVTDPLVLAEDAIGKRVPFPWHLEWAICEVVDLDILACQLVCYLTSAVVGQGKLLAEVTLLAMAQDVSQAGRLHVQPAVHVQSSLRAPRTSR